MATKIWSKHDREEDWTLNVIQNMHGNSGSCLYCTDKKELPPCKYCYLEDTSEHTISVCRR